MTDFDRKGMGVRLAQLRIEKELSQQQVADAIGVGRATYNTIEAGSRPLKDFELFTLSALFDTSVDYILRGIASDNIKLTETTGLSNDAVCYLQRRKHEAETIPNSFISYSNIMYAVEKLLTTKSGNDLLDDLGSFLRCDFTQAYSDTVDAETQSFAPIASNLGFKVNGDLELFQFYRPELFEQSAAELLIDSIRKAKKDIEEESNQTAKKRVRRVKK